MKTSISCDYVGKGLDPFRIMMNEFTKEKLEKIHKEGNGMAQGHSLRRRSRVGKGLDPFQKTVNEFTKEKPEKISNGGNGMAQSHSVRNRPRVGKGLDPFQKTVNEFTKGKTRKKFPREETEWHKAIPYESP